MTGEIFNIPFSLVVSDDIKKRELIIKLKSKKIRLDIFNTLNYKEKNIDGVIDFVLINKENSFNYKISQNSLEFVSTNKNFDGSVDFKPFYFRSNLNFNYLNLKKLFQNNSILINLINSGILNNQNLNGNLKN